MIYIAVKSTIDAEGGVAPSPTTDYLSVLTDMSKNVFYPPGLRVDVCRDLDVCTGAWCSPLSCAYD